MTVRDATFGATFIADLIAIFLFGIATVQSAIFFKTNLRVPYLNKLTVLVLWLLNGLHVVITTHVTYFYLVTVNGDALVPLVWSYIASSVLELFLTNATQILYSIRLWQLLKDNTYRALVFIPVGALIAFCLAMNIYVPFQLSFVENIPALANINFPWAVILDFSASSIIDFVLSLSLIYCLAKSGKKLDWADKSATVVAAYVLNTGIIASIFSLFCIVIYVVMPNNLIFFAFKIVLTGLYINSFLAMLNSRFYFQRGDGLVNVSLPHGNVMMYDHGSHGTRASHALQSAVTNGATINEVGLPLFKPKRSLNDLRPGDMQLVEVKVTKEELHRP